MAKRIPITAIRAEVIPLALQAMAKALEKYEDIVVEEARSLAPVRQNFKNGPGKKRTKSLVGTDLDSGMTGLNPGEKVTKALIGTGRGRGSRRLIRTANKSPLNQRSGRGWDLPIHRLGATSITSQGRLVPNRSGSGSHYEKMTGYRLKKEFDSQLTARARSNLARGIGVNKVGGTSFSKRSAGTLILGGTLRDSIHGMGVEQTKNGLEVRITASVRYAPYVEYGTYKDYAQPFLRPAIKNSKKKLGPLLKAELRGTGFIAKG